MDLSTVYRDPLAGSKPLAAGLPFHFPLTSGSTVEKGSGGTTVVTTTTTRSSTTQQQQPSSGWTEFAPSAKQQAQASPTSAATASSPSPPIIKHVQNNYNIVQNISIKVGGPERDDDADEEAAPAVRAGPPSARGPPPSHSPTPPAHSKPETARPSTTKGPVANASSSAAAHQANRPGTAASGVPKPIPPPNPSVSKSSGVAVGSAPDKATAVSHYAVGKTIGEGTFGKVRAGIHKLTGLPVAIKILEKERIVDLADVERVKREIHILTRVRHPNVIRLFEVIDSPRHIFLIQEYCSAGELFDYIVSQGRVKEDQACRFFHMILNGTDYFHNKNIIHRDLKPENLLLNPSSSAPGAMDIKIVDFGLGNVVKQGRLLSVSTHDMQSDCREWMHQHICLDMVAIRVLPIMQALCSTLCLRLISG
jgi:tRNA A-37 threonylcarbamoyl transferase component Bud32